VAVQGARLVEANTVQTVARRLLDHEMSRRFGHNVRPPGSTEIEVGISSDSDGWRLTGTWINGDGQRAPFRLVRRFVASRDLGGGGSHAIDVMAAAIEGIVRELFPPVVRFRIGTRSPKRLQIARMK
jgi:hypothetical protein